MPKQPPTLTSEHILAGQGLSVPHEADIVMEDPFKSFMDSIQNNINSQPDPLGAPATALRYAALNVGIDVTGKSVQDILEESRNTNFVAFVQTFWYMFGHQDHNSFVDIRYNG